MSSMTVKALSSLLAVTLLVGLTSAKALQKPQAAQADYLPEAPEQKRFDYGGFDKRFDTFDKRFDTFDKRFDTFDKRFDMDHFQQKRFDLEDFNVKRFDYGGARFGGYGGARFL